MWNRYKHGWYASLRRNQDTSPKPTKTVYRPFKMPPQMKKKQKTANDYHVPVPRNVLSEHQRRFLYQKMRTAEFTARDFRLLIEDVKGQWDDESSNSGLKDYMKWKTKTEDDRIVFVALQDFGYEGPSEPYLSFTVTKIVSLSLPNEKESSFLKIPFFTAMLDQNV